MKQITHRVVAAGTALAALSLAAFAPSQSATADGGERIVGGNPADSGEYPYFAALLQKGSGTPFNRQFCGGTLIDSQTVLTAAHCVPGVSAGDIEVVVGRTSLDDQSSGEVIAVDSILSHPQFRDVTTGFDAALLRLAAPSSAPTIDLAGPDDIDLVQPDSPSTVIGHGTTRAGGQGSERLLEAVVPIQSDDYMTRQYEANGGMFGPDTMVGAGPAAGGRDSCQGDSGGPLMVFNGSTPKQVGIVSWGGTNSNPGCAIPDLPGVYSEVYQGELLDWIQSNR
jgi:secreted trypsin-like serine protease